MSTHASTTSATLSLAQKLEKIVSDLPFLAKMLAPSGVAIAIFVAVSVAGAAILSTQSAEMNRLATVQMQHVRALGNVQGEIRAINAGLYQAMTEQAGGQPGAAARVAELGQRVDRLKAEVVTIQEAETNPQVAESLTRLATDLDAFKGVIEFVGSMMEIDFASVVSFLGPFQENYATMQATTDQIIEQALEDAQAQAEQSVAQASAAMMLLGALALLAALCAGAFAFLVARATGGSIGRIAQVTRALAEGNLDVDASALARKDELGSVVDSLSVFRANALEISQKTAEIESLRHETERKLNEVIGSVVEAAGAGDFSRRAPVDASLGGFLPIAQGLNSICAAAEGFLEEIERQAEALAAGDLSRRIDARFQGRFKTVADNLSNAGGALAEAERKRLSADLAKEEEARREQAEVVDALAEGLGALAKGNLTYRLNQEFAGRYRQLRDDFNKSIDRLEEAMRAVTTNTRAIDTGAGEVAQAADDLARRTEHQAAALEQSSAMLARVTDGVNKTAEGARLANDTVGKARQDAEHSGQIVREAIAAMGAISSSAQQISQITGVIDEIAFQTNLLALNAGVEAARAGDAGRGFAVVASEVRALAQRSAEAAKEIKQLITVSADQVASGVQRVGDTGQALQRIVERVNEISAHVAEIASSAKEQAHSLGQVNASVNQMDQGTQQNAAMVEETTAAIHSLANETKQLAAQVALFTIRAADTQALRAAPRPQRAAVSAVKHAAPALKHSSALAEDWQEF